MYVFVTLKLQFKRSKSKNIQHHAEKLSILGGKGEVFCIFLYNEKALGFFYLENKWSRL